MIQYNDYELLYLMSEFDEEAEKIFFDKYTILIKARIRKFNIKDRYKDDFLQEGYFMLVHAIRTYNEYMNKSFNKYFDLILQRKFINILAKERHYFYDVDILEDVDVLKETPAISFMDDKKINFSNLEERVIYLKERNYRPKEIAEVLNVEVKMIYNTICRIKKKINNK